MDTTNDMNGTGDLLPRRTPPAARSSVGGIAGERALRAATTRAGAVAAVTTSGRPTT
ncbi:hypothetical protein [Streptomyces sp. NPDC087787]|uniref:hypothetical protein n=1 Tax=Streptomyces sp. NPDC087787 TaxID=3365803 RepID=UPI0037F9CF9A